MLLLFRLILLTTVLTLSAGVCAQDSPARVTILYDAIGKSAELKHGWGYSALIEYNGKRILFDTGGRLNDFTANVKSLGPGWPPQTPPPVAGSNSPTPGDGMR